MWQEQKSGSRLVRNEDLTVGKVSDSKAIRKSLFVMAVKGAAKYCGFKPCWLADREPRGNGEMPVSLLISFDAYFYRLTRTFLDWVSCCSSSLTRAWKNAEISFRLRNERALHVYGDKVLARTRILFETNKSEDTFDRSIQRRPSCLPIGKALLTSLFTFLLISIRLT